MMTTLFFALLLLAKLTVLCLTLPGTIELLLLTLAALSRKQSLLIDRSMRPVPLPRLVIVVPAHNEAGPVIAGTGTGLTVTLNIVELTAVHPKLLR